MTNSLSRCPHRRPRQHDKTAYVIDDGSPAGGAQATTFVSRWQLDGTHVAGHASVAPTASYVNLCS